MVHSPERESAPWSPLKIVLVTMFSCLGTLLLIIPLLECLPAPFQRASQGDTLAQYPLSLLLGLVSAVVVRHYRRPYAAWWPSFARGAVFVCSLCAPLLIIATHTISKVSAQRAGTYYLHSLDAPVFQASAFAGVCLYLTMVLLFHLVQTRSMRANQYALLYFLNLAAWFSTCLVTDGYSSWLD